MASPFRRIRGKSPAQSPSSALTALGAVEDAGAIDGAAAGASTGNILGGEARRARGSGARGAAGRGRGRTGRVVQAAGGEESGAGQPLRRSARIAVLGESRGGGGGGGGPARQNWPNEASAPGVGATRASGARVVSGFGDERVDDVAAHEERMDAGAIVRAARRRAEGTRGRMTGFSGEDLDRAAGGPWQAGRR